MAEDQLVLQDFTSLLAQVKLFHWATMSFAMHKALDELHASLSEKVDTLVESYLGRTKKQPLRKFTITCTASTDVAGVEAYLIEARDHILKLSTKWAKYPELQNTLQEMATDINQTLYLCRLS